MAGLFFGLAIGSKYHGLLLVCLFEASLLLIYFKTKPRPPAGSYLLHLLLLIVVGSPFYILNLINLGNPIWPLFADRFGEDDLLTRMASGYRMPPRFDAELLWMHVREPFCINLMVLLPSLFFLPQIPRCKACQLLAATVIGYVGSTVMLTSYHRFFLLIWPQLSVMAICGIAASLQRPWKRRIVYTAIFLSTATGTTFSLMYSLDFLKWAAGIYSSEDIRNMSFYYPDYKWINQNLDRSRHKVLVIVRSGHTYYLDIPYLRADPSLTATIDWDLACCIDCSELKEYLRKEKITHIFVDRKLNARVNKALDKLEEMESIREIRSSKARGLLNQRMTRKTSTTTVRLFEVKPSYPIPAENPH